jgi:hypothetical protein
MKLITNRKPQRQEAVEIKEKRFGYFPKAFRWHGKHYDVQAVERCWTIVRRAPQLCFRVRCHEGTFDLFQNVRDNTWHLVPIRA